MTENELYDTAAEEFCVGRGITWRAPQMVSSMLNLAFNVAESSNHQMLREKLSS